MRLKNNLNNNVSVSSKGSYIVIPAGAVLELADEAYLKVEKKLAPMVKLEELTILKGVAKTEEQLVAEHKAALESAKALLAAEKPVKVDK